jgi:CRISPR-associated endonuclease Csy4
MTSHYLDLSVRPDAQIGAAHLMGALCDRLHLALAEHRIDTIGASFPDYRLKPRSIGNVLRLHGTTTALQDFLQNDWLKAMGDHVHVGAITEAPAGAAHRTVCRKQFKTNVERLRRRRMKRKGESIEQARTAIPDSVERRPHLPFLQLHSRSTRQPYCMFIALGPEQPKPTPGTFNSHGLSHTTTVPWF